MAEIGADCENSEVGQRSTKFSLREAWDSLQDDIELSSLAGTDGNTCGLNKTKKNESRGFSELQIRDLIPSFFPPLTSYSMSGVQ